MVNFGAEAGFKNGNAGEGFGGVSVGGFLARHCARQESRRPKYVRGMGFEPMTSAV